MIVGLGLEPNFLIGFRPNPTIWRKRNGWKGKTDLKEQKVKKTIALALLLVAGMVAHSAVPVLSDCGGTRVGGLITCDTVWNSCGSPYTVVTDVTVSSGVTLTVGSSVAVKFQPGTRMVVNGGLVARGTANQPILFTSNRPQPAPGDWKNIDLTNAITTTMSAAGRYLGGSILSRCLIEYGGGGGVDGAIKAYALLIERCTIRNNASRGVYTANGILRYNVVQSNSSPGHGGGIYAHNTRSDPSRLTIEYNIVTDNSVPATQRYDGGGIYVGCLYDEGVVVVKNNTVTNNAALNGNGGGIYLFCADWAERCRPLIKDNTFTGNSAWRGGGMSIDSSLGIAYLTGNTIRGNSALLNGGGVIATNSIMTGNIVSENSSGGQGSGVHLFGTGDFEGNTVVYNSGPTSWPVGGLALSGAWEIHWNNLANNGQYNVVNVEPIALNGRNNWWGGTEPSAIERGIYDGRDDAGRGIFEYIPWLTAPSRFAPPIPTSTPTPTRTPTRTRTSTPTLTLTLTPTSTATPTWTPTSTRTRRPTRTPTMTPTPYRYRLPLVLAGTR